MAKNIKNSGGADFNIYIDFGQDKEQIPHLKDFYWYEPKLKKSYTFKCSKLNFKQEYIKEIDDYVNTPIPITENIAIKSLNKDSLRNSINEYLNYNSSNLEITAQSDKGLVVSISNEELDDFTDYLKRKGFIFNIL